MRVGSLVRVGAVSLILAAVGTFAPMVSGAHADDNTATVSGSLLIPSSRSGCSFDILSSWTYTVTLNGNVATVNVWRTVTNTSNGYSRSTSFTQTYIVQYPDVQQDLPYIQRQLTLFVQNGYPAACTDLAGPGSGTSG